MSKRTVSKVFIAVIISLFVSIVVRFLVRNLLIEPFEMDNLFTRIIMYDNEILKKTSDASEDTKINIDSLYPFYDENGNIIYEKNNKEKNEAELIIEKYEQFIEKYQKKIDDYSSKHVAGYILLKDCAAVYDRTINWNFSSTYEYNPIVFLKDGYLTNYEKEADTDEYADNLIGLKNFCEEENTDFLYIQLPYKISKYTDTDISGTVDFSNQNADRLIEKIKVEGVDVYDFRDVINEDGLSHHKLFYRTDHHWKIETGLWASGKIAEYLNDNYEYDGDVSVLKESRFRKDVYESVFLGSKGKKVTARRADPEDFVLMYPEFDCSLNIKIPKYGLDKTGDFSVFYDMSKLIFDNFDDCDLYGTFLYGIRSVVNIRNLNSHSGKKVLLVCDSFGATIAPFLSLTSEYTDVINLRHFTGSLETYIRENDPDIVIVAYNPSALVDDIEYEGHESTFDFR